MEQIAQEELKILARKAQLRDELETLDRSLSQLRAFAQGYQAAATEKPQVQPEE